MNIRFIWFLFFIVGSVYSSMFVIKNNNGWDSLTKEYPLIVAYIFEFSADEKKESEKYKKIQQHLQTIKAVSNMPRYKNAQIAFIAVNLAHKKLESLKSIFNVTQLPCIMLFRQRSVYTSSVLTEPFDQKKIRDYIENNFREFIDAQRRLYKKNQEKSQKTQLSKKTKPIPTGQTTTYYTYPQPPYVYYRPPYYYNYNPYWYWDWPCSYYNYGPCVRPGIGFGFSIGI